MKKKSTEKCARCGVVKNYWELQLTVIGTGNAILTCKEDRMCEPIKKRCDCRQAKSHQNQIHKYVIKKKRKAQVKKSKGTWKSA